MRQLLISAFLVVGLWGCGPVSTCQAEGVWFLGQENSHGQEMPAGWTCEVFQRTVELTFQRLEEMAPRPKLDRKTTLYYANGYTVEVRDKAFWDFPPYPYPVAGLTWCTEKRVLVNAPPPNETDTLIHELVHVAQNCLPGHTDWNLKNDYDRSIYDVIRQVFDEIRAEELE